MPRGGARVGAGRKPKEKAGVVIGIDGARRQHIGAPPPPSPPAAAAAQAPDLSIPPAGVSETQQAFWRENAPHAIEQRTLVAATVVGFRELCELYELKQAIAASIQKLKLGAASKSAEGKLRAYMKLSQRMDAGLARFKLTPFGRPAENNVSSKPRANPWAVVAGR